MRLKKGLLYKFIKFWTQCEPNNTCQLIILTVMTFVISLHTLFSLICVFLAIGTLFISYPEDSYYKTHSQFGMIVIFICLVGAVLFVVCSVLDKIQFTSLKKIIKTAKEKTCFLIEWEDKE
jgi:predicted membrane protein